MSTRVRAAVSFAGQAHGPLIGRVRRGVGAFFVWTGGIHVGIATAGPEAYRSFADAALFGVVDSAWDSVFMAHPTAWGLALAAAETAMGALLLVGGRVAGVGWVGTIVFHLLLGLFGFGLWLWCIPALVLLSVFAWLDHATGYGSTEPARAENTRAPVAQGVVGPAAAVTTDSVSGRAARPE